MALLIILLRFLGHIPTFWFAVQCVSLYQTVRAYPDLMPISPGSHLRISLHLPAIAVSTPIYGHYKYVMIEQAWIHALYNFITFGVAGFVPSFVFLPFDVSFCAILLTAVSFQSPYIPKLPRDCKHSSNTLANGYFRALAEAELKTWKPTTDDDGNPVSPPSPTSECMEFYTVWALEITIL